MLLVVLTLKDYDTSRLQIKIFRMIKVVALLLGELSFRHTRLLKGKKQQKTVTNGVS